MGKENAAAGPAREATCDPVSAASSCTIDRAAAGARAAPPPPLNVIVVLCDNLCYGDIEPFGSAVHRTPALSRMAREGRTFTHFSVAAGVCTPSRASLLTGRYAQRSGMHWNPRDGTVSGTSPRSSRRGRVSTSPSDSRTATT